MENKNSKSSLNRKGFYENDEVSKCLIDTYSEELDDFFSMFHDNEDCRNALIVGRRWRLTPKGSIDCKCPYCKTPLIIRQEPRSYLRKIKNADRKGSLKVKRYRLRCLNPMCRLEFNPTTDTEFDKQSTRLWLWFLMLYCMGLLNGAVPRMYLIKKYYDFLVGESKIEIPDGDDVLKRQAFKNIGDQVNRAAIKLQKLFNEGCDQEKRRYLRYVGFNRKYQSTFLDWYKAKRKDVVGWWMSWTPGKCDVNNDIAKVVAKKRGEETVHDVQYINGFKINIKKKWVLCFKISKKNKVEDIRWLYVDVLTNVTFSSGNEIEIKRPTMTDKSLNESEILAEKEIREKMANRFKYKKDFSRYQIIQVIKNIKSIQRPFRITNDFLDAFCSTIEKYTRKRIMDLDKSNVLNCPAEILHETANAMITDLEYNEEIKGSWF